MGNPTPLPRGPTAVRQSRDLTLSDTGWAGRPHDTTERARVDKVLGEPTDKIRRAEPPSAQNSRGPFGSVCREISESVIMLIVDDTAVVVIRQLARLK